MKRIVIDNRISGTTTGRYSDKLVEYLYKLKPDYDIVILTRTPRVEFIQKIAPSFSVVDSNFADFSISEQTGLLKQLNSLKADLVHFPMVQQPVRYKGLKVTSMLDLTTMRYKNPTKNPLVFTAKQKVYFRVNRFAAKTSNHIITISDYVRDELIKMFDVPKDKITTTYNAADKIRGASQPIPKLVDRQFIFYTGRPQPHKNLKRLIQAHELLQQDFPELKLVLSGKKDALYEQLEHYVDEQGVKGVVFTGFTEESELKWLYENTLAYVFPSLSEGFGLPGLEAMVHGAPVASSNATCLPEIYGDAALYFDPLDTHDMAEKISQLIKDTALRQKLINKGYKQAGKYSWEKMAKQTLAIYEKVLTKN